MFPLPGSPSASRAVYRARLASLFEGADPKVCIAFWLFGLINNVLYVIILTAALDLVGPDIPKAVVLLSSTVPGLGTKVLTPTFLHMVPYNARIFSVALCSVAGMFCVALTPDYVGPKSNGAKSAASIIGAKMFGVALSSVGSSIGEVTFLGLTHAYGPFSLAGWASGTGAAGLVGAGLYSVATTGLGFSSRETLSSSAFLPLVMLLAFFVILPRTVINTRHHGNGQDLGGRPKMVIPDDDDRVGESTEATSYGNGDEDEGGLGCTSEERALLPQDLSISGIHQTSDHKRSWSSHLITTLQQLRPLLFPYMLPLLLVYFAEYTINLGILPTILFPLSSTSSSSTSTRATPPPPPSLSPPSPSSTSKIPLPSFLHHYRDFYPTYSTIYQTGVFISRSSSPFIRIHRLYPPSLLQLLNLFLLLGVSLAPGYIFPDNGLGLWLVFLVVFWEGLLGGGVYVNVFAEVREKVQPPERREWSLGAVSMSDSAGIAVAGFVSLAVETALCRWQQRVWDRDWCTRL